LQEAGGVAFAGVPGLVAPLVDGDGVWEWAECGDHAAAPRATCWRRGGWVGGGAGAGWAGGRDGGWAGRGGGLLLLRRRWISASTASAGTRRRRPSLTLSSSPESSMR